MPLSLSDLTNETSHHQTFLFCFLGDDSKALGDSRATLW